MTNKEASKVLEHIKFNENYELYIDKEDVEAINLAIKALEERPTEFNCSHCDYWKFSRAIIHGFVDLMVAHGIESIEELEEELHRLNQNKQGADHET